MTKKELEAKVAELEKEVQMANRRNDEYSDLCKSYSELVDTLKSELTDGLEENKKLKAEIKELEETKKESVEETKVEAKPEPKFKVGDRVKCIENCSMKRVSLLGKVGTIIPSYGYSGVYLVEFDENIDGHDGSISGSGKPGHCWYCSEHRLELVKKEPKKEEPTRKFKVGDRVKCVKVADGNERTLNKIGTVKCVGTSSRPYAVVFDEDVDGHNLLMVDINCEYGRGWWCSEDELELVKEEPKFKVGDRVKCIKDWCGNRKIVNEVGTIVYINWDTVWVGVEFDNDVGGHGGLISYNSNKHGHCWNMDISCIELVKEEPKKPEHKYKVGDRVKCVKVADRNEKILNKIGTVKHVVTDSRPYAVVFDADVGGHRLVTAGINCEYGHGWWCSEDELELVKEEPEPKFKVGDRVKAIKPKDDNTLIVGKIGTIKALYSDVDHRYRVEFDELINGHSCGGNAKYGYGWNCDEDTLELVKPEPKFRIGDRVKVLSCGTGTIKGVRIDSTFPIEFDRSLGFVGHTCSGLCKDRHGLWVHEDLIKPLDENAELKKNVLNAIRICSDDCLLCDSCPYHDEENCSDAFYKDALKILGGRE